MNVAVIGAGLAGLAAVSRLDARGCQAVAYEASDDWGGHARSEDCEGFVFDEGPHVSFTPDPEVRRLFESGAGDVCDIPFSCTNIYRGRRIAHPVQCHLNAVPPDLAAACVLDLIKARRHAAVLRTYREWCVDAFGETFTREFAAVYTRKYWTVALEALTTDWIGRRVYRPSLEDVVKGALAATADGGFHYLSTVRYPRRGGFRAFARRLYRPDRIVFNKAVAALDPRARVLHFADGTASTYDQVVSTMPLPTLVHCIGRAIPVPEGILRAAEQLLCTSLVLVDIAVDLPDFWPAHHIAYVYDEDVACSRISFPHLLSPENCPPGKGSIQAEIYFSRARPLTAPPSVLAEQTVDDLVRLGVLPRRADVRWMRHRVVPHANVVFTPERAPALAEILPWLKMLDVAVAGRYGEWAYYWTDDAVRSGWRAADAFIAAGAARAQDRIQGGPCRP
jgi:protoporphyrinogen oxidase